MNDLRDDPDNVLQRDVLALLKEPRATGLRVMLLGFFVAGVGFLIAYAGFFRMGWFVLFLGWLIGVVGLVIHWARLLR